MTKTYRYFNILKHFDDSTTVWFPNIYFLIQLSIQDGNVLFNNELNTFYLWIYDVRHMVEDQSDSERGNPLHGLFLQISSKESVICTIPQTGQYIPRTLLQVRDH